MAFWGADGKLESITHLNGARTIYEYDTDGNISRLATFLEDSKPLFDFRYEYDLNGNRTAKAGVRILPEESESRKTIINYRYDNMNRLAEESYDGESMQYVYDLCGNRLEKDSVAEKERYCYNRRNQLIERQVSEQSYAYQYDKQGNILEESGNGEERRYHYNPFGQQTKVEGNGFKLENFYDGEKLRAGNSVNGKASRFIYYNGELQAETGEDWIAGNRHILRYGIAASEVEERNGYHSYHLDERNNTVYITGDQRNVENFYEYDAFGAIRSKSEEIKNRILYTGQQYDQETGQYYLRARFYNPVVGRFLQEDQYRGDGLNLYAYCGNNPVVYYDPSGYKCKNDDQLNTESSPAENVKNSGFGNEGSGSSSSKESSYSSAKPTEAQGFSSKGYNPKPSERTFEGYVKNNVSIDAEVSLYTNSSGFNNNSKGIGGEFKRFGSDSHGGLSSHVHQPVRNISPKTGDIFGGTFNTSTKTGGVTSPNKLDVKQLYQYLNNGKYR